jgi:hypothetical protein
MLSFAETIHTLTFGDAPSATANVNDKHNNNGNNDNYTSTSSSELTVTLPSFPDAALSHLFHVMNARCVAAKATAAAVTAMATPSGASAQAIAEAR